MNNSVRQWALIALRYVLGITFLLSAFSKLGNPPGFLGQVYAYEMVNADAGAIVAMWLPWIELLLGICLLSGFLLHGALIISTSLAVGFVYLQASALSRGLDIDCGCFGNSIDSPIDYSTIARTAFFLALCVTAATLTVIKNVPLQDPQVSLPQSP